MQWPIAIKPCPSGCGDRGRGPWNATRHTRGATDLRFVRAKSGPGRSATVADRESGHSTSPCVNVTPNGRFRVQSRQPDCVRLFDPSGSNSHWERHGRTSEISLQQPLGAPQLICSTTSALPHPSATARLPAPRAPPNPAHLRSAISSAQAAGPRPRQSAPVLQRSHARQPEPPSATYPRHLSARWYSAPAATAPPPPPSPPTAPDIGEPLRASPAVSPPPRRPVRATWPQTSRAIYADPSSAG